MTVGTPLEEPSEDFSIIHLDLPNGIRYDNVRDEFSADALEIHEPDFEFVLRPEPDAAAVTATHIVDTSENLAAQVFALAGKVNELKVCPILTRDGMQLSYDHFGEMARLALQSRLAPRGRAIDPDSENALRLTATILFDHLRQGPFHSSTIADAALILPFDVEALTSGVSVDQVYFGMRAFIGLERGAIQAETFLSEHDGLTLNALGQSSMREDLSQRWQFDNHNNVENGFYNALAQRAVEKHFGLDWEKAMQNPEQALLIRDLSLWVGAAFNQHGTTEKMGQALAGGDAHQKNVFSKIDALAPKVAAIGRFRQEAPESLGIPFLQKIAAVKLT